jgi:hypothetical protein
VSINPNPFREAISDNALNKWLSQFLPDEQDVIQKLLAHFRFYVPNKVNTLLRRLHTSIERTIAELFEKIAPGTTYASRDRTSCIGDENSPSRAMHRCDQLGMQRQLLSKSRSGCVDAVWKDDRAIPKRCA